MSDELGSQMVLQRMNEIGQAIEQIRSAQMVASEHSRDLAVRMERIATNMDQVTVVVARQSELERRFDQMDIRMSLVEAVHKAGENCVRERHDERITKIEHNWMKVSGMAMVLIAVVTFLVHEVWPK